MISKKKCFKYYNSIGHKTSNKKKRKVNLSNNKKRKVNLNYFFSILLNSLYVAFQKGKKQNHRILFFSPIEADKNIFPRLLPTQC